MCPTSADWKHSGEARRVLLEWLEKKGLSGIPDHASKSHDVVSVFSAALQSLLTQIGRGNLRSATPLFVSA